ncbi:hypothetical protein [Jatrophihabitans endophyticus]|uniref:hypothetical protein n=1 Tax=Jatrophihabitans endophyticus TaxID=1206085 RepID=UPI0019F4F5D1|nr:hypothetical protein [Jatrophihabitans endophyticus]MBE7186652.1 hypothetical protein [Jatrophihabitans endophyticus]
MMPHVNAHSSWAVGTTIERAVMAAVGIVCVATGAVLLNLHHVSAGSAVLGVAVLALVAFVYVEVEMDSDLLGAGGSPSDAADAGSPQVD